MNIYIYVYVTIFIAFMGALIVRGVRDWKFLKRKMIKKPYQEVRWRLSEVARDNIGNIGYDLYKNVSWKLTELGEEFDKSDKETVEKYEKYKKDMENLYKELNQLNGVGENVITVEMFQEISGIVDVIYKDIIGNQSGNLRVRGDKVYRGIQDISKNVRGK